MRKLLVGLFGAATLTIATGAQAAVTIDADNVDVALADDQDVTFALAFGELGGGSPFDHFITFTETLDGTYGFTVTTTATTNGAGGPIVAATDVDFTHIWLSDGAGGPVRRQDLTRRRCCRSGRRGCWWRRLALWPRMP